MANEKQPDEGTWEAEMVTGVMRVITLLVRVLEMNGALNQGQFAANLEHQLGLVPEERQRMTRNVPLRLLLRSLGDEEGGGLQ